MRWLVASIILLVSLGSPAFAAEIPPEQQALLLLRTLAYDRNLEERAGSKLTIAVVYTEEDATSKSWGLDITRALASAQDRVRLNDLDFEILPIQFSDPEELGIRLKLENASAMYVCPGLRSDTADVTSVTRDLDVLSFTSEDALVEQGVSIGFDVRAGRPTILVNLPASIEEGAHLEATLLNLALVYR